MEVTDFTIFIKNKQFIVETENTYKDMNSIYYINYDTDYEYIYDYVKNNGKIEISVNNNNESIYISTVNNNYLFEYYMFDGDFESSDNIDEYELGFKCYEFYKYYFND
tara:strand:- start:650 stop:973 length:324 start_codon:yes stop_codon:yes gene_type:complete